MAYVSSKWWTTQDFRFQMFQKPKTKKKKFLKNFSKRESEREREEEDWELFLLAGASA